MSGPTFEVFVFSYQRPKFLANLLSSLRRHASQLPVTVIDDGSTGHEMEAVLEDARASGMRVVETQLVIDERLAAEDLMRLRGGLYANMQSALEQCESDFYVFLQDDTQVCRPIRASDLESIAAAFAAYPDSAFVSPTFFKASHLRAHYDINRANRLYLRGPEFGGSSHFKAVHVGHVPRLRRAGWKFAGSEAACSAQARETFGQMLHLSDPWAVQLPFTPTIRVRRTGPIESRLQRRWAGFHPIVDMDDRVGEAFLQRDVEVLPVAERFLMAQGVDRRRVPWVHAWGPRGVLQRVAVGIERRVLRTSSARRGEP